jgi:hypothetical protein
MNTSTGTPGRTVEISDLQRHPSKTTRVHKNFVVVIVLHYCSIEPSCGP